MMRPTLFSLGTLLCLLSQFISSYCAAIPDEHTELMNRRDFYDNLSRNALDYHLSKKREYEDVVTEFDKKHHDIKNKNKKREDYDWHPANGFSWGSGFGHHSFHAQSECGGTGARYRYMGAILRMITWPSEAGREYSWWLNKTYYQKSMPAGTKLKCFQYGTPTYRYHEDGGDDKQCVDKIWFSASKTWQSRSSSNANVGWTTNNASYGNQEVRTIYDCLLDRVAVEYKKNHPALGHKPVRYILDNQRYFRFYDSNNFAWFLSCPSSWAVKRDATEIQKKDTSALQERDTCFDCDGNNPVWDFMAEKLHNPLADHTPLQWYRNGIEDYRDVKPSYLPYKENTVFAINYWPPRGIRNVTVEGRQCTQLAVSRPGLRHWTVRFFDNPDYYYVQKTSEWGYPQDWQDITQELNSTESHY